MPLLGAQSANAYVCVCVGGVLGRDLNALPGDGSQKREVSDQNGRVGISELYLA